MTTKERDVLDQLVREVGQYRSSVEAHMARCEACNRDVRQHHTDLYGNPDDREGNPGLMSQMADLRKGRRVLMAVAAGAWTLATIFIGAAISNYI